MMDGKKTNIHELDKGRLRKLALSCRDDITAVQRCSAALTVTGGVMALPELKDAGIIMSYMSFRSEFPTAQLNRELEKAGKKLCYPLCRGGGIMQAYHPADEYCWKRGYMGIMEPDAERSELITPQDIDIVVCPMVAFDKDCRRMGYGGGYYDRYLPQCKNAIRVGVAFEAQRLDIVPADGYDQLMDIIITEENIYKK